jgi:hypothetical protein
MGTESLKKINLAEGYIPIAAIMVFISATWWLSGRLALIDSRLDRIERSITVSWSRIEMENYVLRAQKVLPQLPDLPSSH